MIVQLHIMGMVSQLSKQYGQLKNLDNWLQSWMVAQISMYVSTCVICFSIIKFIQFVAMYV